MAGSREPVAHGAKRGPQAEDVGPDDHAGVSARFRMGEVAVRFAVRGRNADIRTRDGLCCPRPRKQRGQRSAGGGKAVDSHSYDPAEPILRSLAADGGGNVLHSEKGEVSCRCPTTGTVRPMAFQGFEADPGTLKYRCPAAAYGLDCAGLDRCLRDAGSGAGDYGRVVRLDLAGRDRRTFTPTPWGSPSWKRGYARRAALERINSRLDGSFGFERHFVRGRAKMKTRLGLAVAVMMALALGAVLADRRSGCVRWSTRGCVVGVDAAATLAPRFRYSR